MARRKKKAPVARRVKGLAGGPLDKGWQYFYEYVRLECTKQEVGNRIKEYIKEVWKDDPDEKALLLSASEGRYKNGFAFAAGLEWKKLGKEMPTGWSFDLLFTMKMADIRRSAINRRNMKDLEDDVDEPAVPEPVKKNPAQIIAAKTADMIGDIEEVIDQWGTKDFPKKFSLFTDFKSQNAAANIAKSVKTKYTPLLKELKELLELKTKKRQSDLDKQLEEGYSHLTQAKRKKYYEFIKEIVDDCDRYIETKKAVRKSRKPVAMDATKLTSKMNYLNESIEYKVKSISPEQIIRAQRVWLFNTKYKSIVELVAKTFSGLTVSGSTIKDFDEEKSRSKNLRKPHDFLPAVMTKTPSQIDKEWSKLTTKDKSFTGRVNKDVIILKVSDK